MTATQITPAAFFLDDLCKRWRLLPDQILEAALHGQLPLWIDFSQVYLVGEGKSAGRKSKKKLTPAKTFHQQVAVRPAPEVLAMVQGRCDRMLVAAELACLDEQDVRVFVSNSVGEEWGETSMIGLKPAHLYAKNADVARYERAAGLVPVLPPENKAVTGPSPAIALPVNFNPPEHPHHAEELHIAALCWQSLYASRPAGAKQRSKEETLQWLASHYPHLSKAAAARIALVIAPNGPAR